MTQAARDSINLNQQEEDVKEIFKYLTDKYAPSLREVLIEPDPLIHYDMAFDLLEFIYHFPWFGANFHSHPEDFLNTMRKFFVYIQENLLSKVKETYSGCRVKQYLDVRLFNVPMIKEVKIDSIRNIKEYHVGKYISLFGTTIRTTGRKDRELQCDVECVRCGTKHKVNSDLFQYSKLQMPLFCGGTVEKKYNPYDALMNKLMRKKANKGDENGKGDMGMTALGTCMSRKFSKNPYTSIFSDYQEIKVQELFKTLKPGNIPRSIIVILEDNLVDVCKPGDDVLINGIIIQRWSDDRKDERPNIEIAILANYIIVLNKKEFIQRFDVTSENKAEFKKFWKDCPYLEGRNKLIESICPYIYEKNEQKLGMLLAIIGGVPKLIEKDNTKIRGQIHMLMVGEPGTGKSCLLCFAQKLSMRSVMTTGIGTTSAGLTVAAFKDGNEWILEAGALVLADCGVCCIDEFALIRQEDRGSVHEAMEQQTLSIAKAGLVCKINARATIIAATNPSGSNRIDMNYNNGQNTGISSSLLSRFDLIFMMKDEHLVEYDSAHANFKLSMNTEEEAERDPTIWGVEKLGKYILYIQREFSPELSDYAIRIFQNYYQYLRKRERLPQDRKTVRMLESLIRISEAHARLMMRNEIIVLDAIVTIILMEHCLNSGLLEELFPVIMSFDRYTEAKHEILLRLGLNPGEFPDPNMKKNRRRNKKKKSGQFSYNSYMDGDQHFSGTITSQDEINGGDNYFVGSSQQSVNGNKSDSQTTFCISQGTQNNNSQSNDLTSFNLDSQDNSQTTKINGNNIDDDDDNPGNDDLADISALL